MSILFYKKPCYVPKVDGPLNLSDCQKHVERTKDCKVQIPSELSFETIVSNKALPVGESTIRLKETMSHSLLAVLSPRLS